MAGRARLRRLSYLREIIQALGIAVASGYVLAYYVALTLTRRADDDKVCRAKYRELWDRYTAKVRWRIVPRVY